MLYVFILAMLVFFYGINFVKANEFNTEYLSKESTGAVNGIFVLFVFMSHISNYMDFGSEYDKIWLDFRSWLGQLMVVSNIPVLFGLRYDVFDNEEGKRLYQTAFQKKIFKFAVAF